MRSWARVLSIALTAMVAACAPKDDWFGVAGDGYQDEPHRIADAADWSDAETVGVDLTDFAFSPQTLQLTKGRPYALKLTNAGSMTHRFVARGFFRAIAAKSLMYSDAEASYPFLEAIVLKAGETKTVYFVPVVSGDFQITCDMPFHGILGMRGRFLIE